MILIKKMKSYIKIYLIGLKIILTITLFLLPIGILYGLVVLSYFIDINIPKQVLTTYEVEYGQGPRLWVFIFWVILIPFCLALYFPISKFVIRNLKKSFKELRNE